MATHGKISYVELGSDLSTIGTISLNGDNVSLQ
jgi:hypothetical protein